MSDWIICKLGDILNFRRGHDLPKTKMLFGNIPVAGSNGIIGYHNEQTPIKPCITIGRSGNIGTPYIYNNCWAHNTVLYIDDFKGNNPVYLYYLLKTLPLASFGGGSAVPTLNRNHIHPLSIKYCRDINIQEKIANILNTIDSKIELNRRINANLEEQAKALYKSWFVDFEPFKDGAFVDSELGPIPAGWQVGDFTDIVKIKGGGTPKTDVAEYWNGAIPFFTPKDVSNSCYVLRTEKYITNSGLEHCNSALYEKNTVFITARGTVGKIVMAGCNMAMNQTNYALLGKDGVSQLFVYNLTIRLVNRLLKKSNGAVFNAITIKDFESEKIIIPNQTVLSDFSNVVAPVYAMILHNHNQMESLISLRDTLLPKLMNGELL